MQGVEARTGGLGHSSAFGAFRSPSTLTTSPSSAIRCDRGGTDRSCHHVRLTWLSPDTLPPWAIAASPHRRIAASPQPRRQSICTVTPTDTHPPAKPPPPPPTPPPSTGTAPQCGAFGPTHSSHENQETVEPVRRPSLHRHDQHHTNPSTWHSGSLRSAWTAHGRLGWCILEVPSITESCRAVRLLTTPPPPPTNGLSTVGLK
jgi:hypothetical protein